MAIKGKGKTRGGRAVSGAPRPVIVIPKRPFFQRRSVRITALLLVVGTVLGTLFYGYMHNRSDNRRKAQGVAITAFNGQVQSAIGGVGRQVPPSTYQIFPDLVSDLTKFQDGKVKVSEVRLIAKGVPKAVDNAATAINGLEIPAELRNTEHTQSINDAKFLMVQSLSAYKGVAGLLLAAVDLQGKDRTTVLTRAVEQAQLGASLFDRGYQSITNIRVKLGVFNPTEVPLNQPPGG